MHISKKLGAGISGTLAGGVNGLFGAGGGMVLVPLLTRLTPLEDKAVFPASVSVILPICLVSLGIRLLDAPIDWLTALPYLIGSVLGGVAAGIWGKHIPTLWLHRALGLLILWGGVRYLC